MSMIPLRVRPLRLVVLLLAGLALAAAPARAQDSIPFDPGRDLDGFEQASVSEYRILFPISVNQLGSNPLLTQNPGY